MAHEWTGEINLLRVKQEGNRMGYVQYNVFRKHHLDVRADLFPITSISEEGTWPDVSIVYESKSCPQVNQTQVGIVTPWLRIPARISLACAQTRSAKEIEIDLHSPMVCESAG